MEMDLILLWLAYVISFVFMSRKRKAKRQAWMKKYLEVIPSLREKKMNLIQDAIGYYFFSQVGVMRINPTNEAKRVELEESLMHLNAIYNSF